MKKGDFCIAVVVNKKYEKYIPYFIFFILKSYPSYAVKVFFTDKLTSKTRLCIERMRAMGEVEVVESFYSNLPSSNQELKSFRWLIPQDYFSKYKYAYIGDVDMLICREDPPLKEQHIKQMNRTGLTYSNCVRSETKRLTGLHFLEVNPYYKDMSETISKYLIKLKEGKLGGSGNEGTLYKMIEESGIGLPPPGRCDRPHHGLHLGLWRSKGPRAKTRWDVLAREPTDKMLNYYKFFLEACNDPIYLSIRRDIRCLEIDLMEADLNKHLKSRGR